MSKPLAVIAGVGTGLGFSLAKQFSAEYKVILLSRSQDKLDALAKEITAKGGEAIGISTDLNSEENIAETFKKIKTLGQVNVAIFNASGGDRRYFKAPFLTIPADKFEAFWKTSAKGGFLFAQQSLPLLIETAKSNPVHPPTLLFTGATASIKASIDFAAFASSKWALRALSQSLAKEFGPQGVHVGHIIADGAFDTPSRRDMQPDGNSENWMDTDGMAQSYWALHVQPKRAWSWEIDLRPYTEKW